jgi:hypothetical protein
VADPGCPQVPSLLSTRWPLLAAWVRYWVIGWSGWRTLAGLADFAVVQSYLSTARKWGIDSYDALTQLFTTGAWLPPAAAPC